MKVPETSQLRMFTFPVPVGVVTVKFVIFRPEIVQPVFVLIVPETTMFPPISPGPVIVVY